jgi:ankyrin repeat protein
MQRSDRSLDLPTDIRQMNNLHMLVACQNGDVDAVTMYLEDGADPNYSNSDGETSLIIACRNDYLAIASLLFEYDADNDGKQFVKHCCNHEIAPTWMTARGIYEKKRKRRHDQRLWIKNKRQRHKEETLRLSPIKGDEHIKNIKEL